MKVTTKVKPWSKATTKILITKYSERKLLCNFLDTILDHNPNTDFPEKKTYLKAICESSIYLQLRNSNKSYNKLFKMLNKIAEQLKYESIDDKYPDESMR
jgi:hypothetical protein